MKNKIIILLSLLFIGSTSMFAQSKYLVKGIVYDDLNEPIYGAHIFEESNQLNRIATDLDGKFSINVSSPKSKIIVKFAGMKTLTIPVTVDKEMKIVLELDAIELEEVVAVGFARQRRITHIGSTSQISNKELAQTPASSIQNALVGKLPGLFQQQGSGQPGADAAKIYIRGVASFSGADQSPLVLIDDIETAFSTLSQLDPNEIDNIALLKDASSTAIFGVRGANGVILVTTKRGTEGKPRITYRAEYGLQSPTIHNKVLNSYDAISVMKEYWVNMEKDPVGALGADVASDDALEHFRKGDSPYLYPDVNWYDAVMRKFSSQTRHNIDISGGTKNLGYFVSAGYLFEDGILKNVPKKEDFYNNYYNKRYNLRTNIDIKPTKDLKIAVNVAATLTERNEPYVPDPGSTGGGWPLFRRLGSGILPPWSYPVHNEDGSYGGAGGKSTNPLMMLEYGGYLRNYHNRITSNVNVDYKLDFITEGLSTKATYAITNFWGSRREVARNAFPDFYFNKNTKTYERVIQDVDPLPLLGVTAKIFEPFIQANTQLSLNYARTFGNHSVVGMLMSNASSYKAGSNEPANTEALIARASYDYKFRYMFQVSMSRNGSNRFKGKNKHGYFPSIAAGWNVSEEPFLKDKLAVIGIDFLKVKGSYGMTGSDAFPSGSRYIYQATYERKTASKEMAFFGNSSTPMATVYPGTLGNEDVRWEIERKFDLGADIRFFKSKLRLEIDYFENLRSQILTRRQTIPSVLGVKAPPANLGVVQNRGLEIDGTWRDNFRKVNYFLKGNVSIARNKILEIDEPTDLQYPLKARTGKPVGQIFGYTFDGFYMNEDEIKNLPDKIRTRLKPGDLKYKDISGPNGIPDGIIDIYDEGPIGKPSVSQVTFGLSTGISYKGFDASILFQGAADGSISANQIFNLGLPDGLPREIHKQRWTEDNKYKAQFPRLGDQNQASSSFWLRPRDYVRLKNLEFGYRFPKLVADKLNVNSLRIYGSGMNLCTWSSLSIYDIDPEANGGSQYAAYTSYPLMKKFNLGLQVTF